MRRTKEQAAETRQALLDAGLVVFSKQGFAATRLEDIAEQAGVTRGAIYWHFGSKTDLYLALVQDISSRSSNVIAEAVAEGGSFSQVMQRVIERLIAYPERDKDYRRVLELSLFKTEMTDELQKSISLRTKSLLDGLRQFIQMGIAQGELTGDIDVDDIAFALLSLLQGSSMIWLLDPDQFSLKQSASALAELFMRGLRANS
jgi:TetR/AcrR family acrAB operon transcriptional repressor